MERWTSEEAHQVRGRFDDLDGFSQGSRHGGQLVPDLLRRHVLQERTDRRILFGWVVQVGAEAQCSRRVVDPDLQEASGSRDMLCKKPSEQLDSVVQSNAYLEIAVASSVHDWALQLEGVHEGNQGGQTAELDALVDLSHLKIEKNDKLNFYHVLVKLRLAGRGFTCCRSLRMVLLCRWGTYCCRSASFSAWSLTQFNTWDQSHKTGQKIIQMRYFKHT